MELKGEDFTDAARESIKTEVVWSLMPSKPFNFSRTHIWRPTLWGSTLKASLNEIRNSGLVIQ